MSHGSRIARRYRELLLIRRVRSVLKQMPGFEDDRARLAIAMLQHFAGDGPTVELRGDYLRQPDLYSVFSGEPEYEAYFVCKVELNPEELAEAERRLVALRPEYLGPVIRQVAAE